MAVTITRFVWEAVSEDDQLPPIKGGVKGYTEYVIDLKLRSEEDAAATAAAMRGSIDVETSEAALRGFASHGWTIRRRYSEFHLANQRLVELARNGGVDANMLPELPPKENVLQKVFGSVESKRSFQEERRSALHAYSQKLLATPELLGLSVVLQLFAVHDVLLARPEAPSSVRVLPVSASELGEGSRVPPEIRAASHLAPVEVMVRQARVDQTRPSVPAAEIVVVFRTEAPPDGDDARTFDEKLFSGELVAARARIACGESQAIERTTWVLLEPGRAYDVEACSVAVGGLQSEPVRLKTMGPPRDWTPSARVRRSISPGKDELRRLLTFDEEDPTEAEATEEGAHEVLSGRGSPGGDDGSLSPHAAAKTDEGSAPDEEGVFDDEDLAGGGGGGGGGGGSGTPGSGGYASLRRPRYRMSTQEGMKRLSAAHRVSYRGQVAQEYAAVTAKAAQASLERAPHRLVRNDAGGNVSVQVQVHGQLPASAQGQERRAAEELDDERERLRCELLVEEEQEVARWVAAMTGRELPVGATLRDFLLNGEVLCELANVAASLTAGGREDIDAAVPVPHYHRGAVGKFKQIDNVTHFVRACREFFHLPEHQVFLPIALAEGKDMQAVARCLYALGGRIQALDPSYDGPRLGVTVSVT